MKQTRDTELLADIAFLIKKHGPKAFEDLAEQLKKDQLRDALVVILDSSAQSGRKFKSNLKTKRVTATKPDGATKLLERIRSEDPEKAKILTQIHRKLVIKSILPSLKDIKYFAEINGLQPIQSGSRDRAMLLLLQELSSIPSSDITEMSSKLEESRERTLGGWTEVILGGRN